MKCPHLVMGHDAEITAWVAGNLGIPDFGPSAAIGIATSENKIIAGVVFSQWQPEYLNIQASMYSTSPFWARREVIAGVLSYPFRQLGAWMVYTATPIENTVALRINERMGFGKPVVIGHWYGPNKHGVQRRMLKPEFESLYGGILDEQVPISNSA